MKRICVVITARPSYSRVKSVLTALQQNPDVDLRIVVAASGLVRRFGDIGQQISEDGFLIESVLPSLVEGDHTPESAISTGLLTVQLATLFGNMEPDIVVTIADRHETLATAIAASYQNIPLCHIQGGEVSGSIDDKVRNAVTQLADIHCVATEHASHMVHRLLPKTDKPHVPVVHNTGCPSIDLAAEAVKLGPLPAPAVVVLQHPVTTEEHEAGAQMRETIKALDGLEVLWFWPGEDAGSDAMSKELRLAGLKPKRNLPPLDFLRTLLGCGVLVGNSSAGIREASFLGVPVVNIGTRQQGRQRGPNVLDVGHDASKIRSGVNTGIYLGRAEGSTLYGDGHAGERIAEVLVNGAAEAVA